MSYKQVRELMIAGNQKTCFLSSPTGIMQDASEHGMVLMMGSPAVPSLLQMLKDGEGNTHAIFMMLHLLSRERPEIPKEIAGRVNIIKQLWLEIGYKNNWIKR